MANQGNQTMRIPLERVALILTYIKGKNVQDWRTRMVNEIERLTECPTDSQFHLKTKCYGQSSKGTLEMHLPTARSN